MKKSSVTILGSGTSTGIPMLGCFCEVCTSKNPKNRRFRTSIFLETPNNHILVDTTPDLRSQLLDAKISQIDHVLITHDHADHLHGIDDLRPLCFGPPSRTIPIYCSDLSQRLIVDRFPYIFNRGDQPILGGGIPLLELNSIPFDSPIIPFKLGEDLFQFFLLPHGHTQTIGFLYQNFAYLTDCSAISDEIVDFLKKQDIDLLIIDCIREEKHDTHLCTTDAFEYIKRISPKRAGLIHMTHSLEHEELAAVSKRVFSIPVFPVYDGQILQL